MTTLRRTVYALIITIATVILMIAVGARAAQDNSIPPGKWAALTFDPATTTIDYTLTGWPHLTQGTFKLKQGMIRVDPATAKMDGAIVVDAASGNSGHSIRDWRMKSGILDVSRYPDIIFEPRQVVGHGALTGDFPVAVRGIMILHGEKHPFTIHAMVERQGKTVTIHSDFVIPYVAWGIENPSVMFFTVAKKVDLHVTAITHLTWVASFSRPGTSARATGSRR